MGKNYVPWGSRNISGLRLLVAIREDPSYVASNRNWQFTPTYNSSCRKSYALCPLLAPQIASGMCACLCIHRQIDIQTHRNTQRQTHTQNTKQINKYVSFFSSFKKFRAVDIIGPVRLILFSTHFSFSYLDILMVVLFFFFGCAIFYGQKLMDEEWFYLSASLPILYSVSIFMQLF